MAEGLKTITCSLLFTNTAETSSKTWRARAVKVITILDTGATVSAWIRHTCGNFEEGKTG